MNARALFAVGIMLLLTVTRAGAQIETAILRPVGYHLNIIAYYQYGD